MSGKDDYKERLRKTLLSAITERVDMFHNNWVVAKYTDEFKAVFREWLFTRRQDLIKISKSKKAQDNLKLLKVEFKTGIFRGSEWHSQR